MQGVGLNTRLLDDFLTASSEIGGVCQELLVGSLREAINPDVLVDVLEGVLLPCPSNLNSSKDYHSVGDRVAPR